MYKKYQMYQLYNIKWQDQEKSGQVAFVSQCCQMQQFD